MGLTPKIRFDGFVDDWEQRKLGDITDKYKELVPTPQDGYVRMGVRSHAKGTFLEKVELGQQIEEHNLSKVKANNLVVNIVFAWEHAVAITSEKDTEALVSHRFPQFSFHDDMNPDFFRYAILDENFRRNLLLASPSGAGRNKTLNIGAMLEHDFSVPTIDEQSRIADFLKNIDNLITLQQRKCDALESAKKFYLQNMFPKKGETVPKIRFEGFTVPWEQRKVGDFLTISRIPGHTGIDAKKITVKLWGKGIVKKTDSYGGSKNTQYYIRRAGQFMYGKLDFLHAAFGIVPENLDGYESTLDSPAFDLNGIDGDFLLNRVTQEDFYLKNGTVANGSRKAKRIHEDTFMAMPLTVPSLEEQTRIGQLFNNLDALITLHQRKYYDYKLIRKFFLQNMFPN